MRHFLALALLAGRMRESTVAAGLISPARLAQRVAPRPPTTTVGAISIAVVTA